VKQIASQFSHKKFKTKEAPPPLRYHQAKSATMNFSSALLLTLLSLSSTLSVADVCPNNMGHVATLIEFIDANPTDPLPVNVIQNIAFGVTADGTRTVSFQVSNPFDESADIYTEYHTPVAGSSARDGECDKELNVSPSAIASNTITAECLVTPFSAGEVPFSIVSVYFVSALFPIMTIPGGAIVDDWCDLEEGTDTFSAVEYTYQIDCGCEDSI
jgi:hypothetical protein